VMAYTKMPLRNVKPDLKENQVNFFLIEVGIYITLKNFI